MKCPFCNYAHGYGYNPSNNYSYTINGKKGEFFEIKERATRKCPYTQVAEDKETVYACPSCGVLFMDIER